MPRRPSRDIARSAPVALRLTSYRASTAPAQPQETSPLYLLQKRRVKRAAVRFIKGLPTVETAASIPMQASVTPTSLTISLPVPPSINHQYATVNGRRVLSAAGRAYKASVAQQVLIALARSPHRAPLLRTLRVSQLALSIHFYFASPLRRDVDSGLKIAQDALCEALGLNDNRIVEIHLYKARDAHRPRIEVSLSRSS